MTRIILDLEVNGEEHEFSIEGTMASADPDVGIMVPWPEDWWITRVDGEKATKEQSEKLTALFTPKQVEIIEEMLCDAYADRD